MNDDEQLTALFDRMCRARTEGDAQAYGACFTPDCDYVSFDGTRTLGRAQVAASHDKLFRGVPFGSALVGEVGPSATSAMTWHCCTAPARCSLPDARGCPEAAHPQHHRCRVDARGLAVHRHPQRPSAPARHSRTGLLPLPDGACPRGGLRHARHRPSTQETIGHAAPNALTWLP